MFLENLEKNAPWITVDFKGGPEVIHPNLLIEATSAGVVDMAHLPGDYYVNQLPAMDVPRFSPFTPMEERENGVREIYDEIHRDQLGLTYLGHTVSGMPQVILVDTSLDGADLEGKSVRTSPATSYIVEQLGGIPVDLPGGEVYTALERGVVDGATWASVGPASLGLEEVVNYDVSPRFYESVANLVIYEQTWENLEEETREALTRTIAETEPDIFQHYLKTNIEETAVWNEAGVEENPLSDEAAERLLQLAYRDAWQDLDWDSIISATPAAERLKTAYETQFTGELTEVVPGGYNSEATQGILEEMGQ
ncbi:hypothetical protein A605_13600 [Corynebacterium halotolerans YIM 70093 = DSM 44683]|uniref:Uncharacterized protein n=2 Tax=Corynebacterium halotolerans TaxID=225326 RepID=M1PAK9_9CORY|nr:hypothetical protein A605_13600 [Corynebacterium halotolerans YIM 70093 = DSM 44683]